MSDSKFVVNVTTQDFAKLVLEESNLRPVLVDFWANWCAPCRTLGPLLDKLAQEWNGALLVAKVDTDKEISLTAQFGIRSLPTVRLFHKGRSVGEFMGALPESEVRAFLNRHVPKAADQLLAQVDDLLARGQISQAAQRVEQASKSDPNSSRTLLAYAKVKAAQGDYGAAEQALKSLPLQEHNSAEVKSIRARLMFAQVIAQSPNKAVLEQRIATQPDDSEARYQLAAHLVIAGAYQEALDVLLALLRKDRAYGEDAARKAILQIFELLSGNSDLTSRYRAKLTSMLF